MQNRAVRLCCNLRKHDHVSAFYHQLNWLPLSCFVQFKSLCLMHRQYHHFKRIPLELPIVFGRTSSYCTRTPVYFANIPMFHLSLPQRFFHFRAAQWWNSLPFSVTDHSIVHILHIVGRIIFEDIKFCRSSEICFIEKFSRMKAISNNSY